MLHLRVTTAGQDGENRLKLCSAWIPRCLDRDLDTQTEGYRALIIVGRCHVLAAHTQPPNLHVHWATTHLCHFQKTVWFPIWQAGSPSRFSITSICPCHCGPTLQRFRSRKRRTLFHAAPAPCHNHPTGFSHPDISCVHFASMRSSPNTHCAPLDPPSRDPHDPPSTPHPDGTQLLSKRLSE